MNCFWDAYEKDPFPFCEEQLCQFITQPANTWTNIGYFFVAWMIWRDRSLGRERLYFAAGTLALAIGSTLFHISGTMWAKKLDVGAMLFISSICVTLSLRRLLTLRDRTCIAICAALFFSSAPFVGIGKLGGVIFICHCVIAVIVEIAQYWKQRRSTVRPQHNLQISMSEENRTITKAFLVFVIALALNINDQNGNLCIKDNHVLTVHGIWHLMTAYCILLISRFYSVVPARALSPEQSR